MSNQKKKSSLLSVPTSPLEERISDVRARLNVLVGSLGGMQPSETDPEQLKHAKSLAQEIKNALEDPQEESRALNAGKAISLTLAVETLILDLLPIEHLRSSLRNNCLQLLALHEDANSSLIEQDRKFISETIKDLNAQKGIDASEIRRLYLQARHRLDTVRSTRRDVGIAANLYIKSLWTRTILTIMICALPVALFLKAHYWEPETNPSLLAHKIQSEPSHDLLNFDIESAEQATKIVSQLVLDLPKLPTANEKPELTIEDIEDVMKSDDYENINSLIKTASYFSKSSDTPPEVQQICLYLLDADGAQSTEQLFVKKVSGLRSQFESLPGLQDYMDKEIAGRKSGDGDAPPPAGYAPAPVRDDEEFEEEESGRSDDAIRVLARIATLFSVVIMGIAGSFVSNYSRVCALLRESSADASMLIDRGLRVRFSPFIGGLLAFALSEVFGGHLIQGDLFPMTEHMPRWTDLIWHGQAYSKLLVWGFIAGLSENHVLRILSQLASKVSLDDKNTASKA